MHCATLARIACVTVILVFFSIYNFHPGSSKRGKPSALILIDMYDLGLAALLTFYGRTLCDASMLCFTAVFSYFFMAALVGQTAERIFTKLSHVVDIRCYLRTY